MPPLTHQRDFRVRFYECDAYGHVNYSNYLRYMQEAAFDASAAAGYGQSEYDRLGQTWLIRETEVEYLQSLYQDDTLSIKTWVEDFRRVRSRRAYEFRRAGEEQLVARASTDWVYLDMETHRPATIPPEMVAAFYPEGSPPPPPRRPAFPDPTSPAGVVRLPIRVAWGDIDPAQHVNNARYLGYIEEAGVAAAAAHGWPLTRLLEQGFGWVARRLRIEYRQQARFGEQLEVVTFLSALRRASSTRHYLICRAESREMVARASIEWAFVEIASGRPARIPAQLQQDFAPNLSRIGLSQ